MAVSPAYAENLSEQILRLYQDAELRMLQLIARHLAKGLDAPDWAERKLLELQLMEARIRGDLNTLSGKTASEIAEALARAWNRGQAGAVTDIAQLLEAGQITAAAQEAGLPAIEALLGETVQAVTGTHQRILRAVPDIYRQVVRETAGHVLVGTETRKGVAQLVLDRLTRRGITGFVDGRGKGWDLASYAEMAVRSATGRAAIDGHTQRLQQSGHDLVIVSDAPQECRICRPFEGKILSLSGAPRTDGVRPLMTLDQARHEGLFHPNCRHNVTAYLPGFTKRPKDTADPQGDRDRQQLRYLERQVRSWKRAQAVALDDQTARVAGVRARAYQARIRELVDRTSVSRNSAREQIGRAR